MDGGPELPLRAPLMVAVTETAPDVLERASHDSSRRSSSVRSSWTRFVSPCAHGLNAGRGSTSARGVTGASATARAGVPHSADRRTSGRHVVGTSSRPRGARITAIGCAPIAPDDGSARQT